MGFIKLTSLYNTKVWVQVRYIIAIEQTDRGTLVYMRGLPSEGVLRVKESVIDIIAMIGGMEE